MKATVDGVGMTAAQVLARNFSTQRVVWKFTDAKSYGKSVEIARSRKSYKDDGSASVAIVLENGRKVRITYEMI